MTASADLSSETSGDHPRHPSGSAAFPVLSIVVPTFNERDNVRELVARLDHCLAGVAWEIVFVDDDSRDGTLDRLRSISRSDPRVRFLHRIGRRGLASAVVEGALATSAPLIAVMDCDLQHDETLLPKMLAQLSTPDCDLVVASRYMKSGSVGGWTKERLLFSRLATRVADYVLKTPLTDPMSGFFMMKRSAFDQVVRRLSTQGYKILLDILLSGPGLRIKEIPYTFRNRLHGKSKLDLLVIIDYLALLIDKIIGHVIPLRFVMFAAVGGFGLFVHLTVLALLNRFAGVSFVVANPCAATVAMCINFFLNNMLTYRDMRLRRFGPLLRGLLSFCAVCAIGMGANVGIAAVLYQQKYAWWLAATAGIFMGAIWNYTATSIFTWKNVPTTERPVADEQAAMIVQPGAGTTSANR
jgi:dolichol-phosphate mannosyltransferase